MNADQLFADIETGCLTEVAAAACMFYSEERGLSVRQSFYVYPNGMVVCLNCCDGNNETRILDLDDTSIFFHYYMQ